MTTGEHELAFPDSARNSIYRRGQRVTGYVFGRGGDVSARVYDKTFELGIRARDADTARRQLEAAEKREREAAIWSAHGWRLGEPVTRVEVQVRSTGLAEMAGGQGRCEVQVAELPPIAEMPDRAARAARRRELVLEAGERYKKQVRDLTDGIWQYMTRQWVKAIIPTRTRTGRPERPGRCAVQPWWQAVQRVTFHARVPPTTRRRVRTRARSAQALGATLSLVTAHGLTSPWLDPSEERWRLPHEKAVAKRAEHLGMAVSESAQALDVTRQIVEEAIEEVFHAAAPIVARDLCEALGGPRKALERLVTRWTVKTVQLQPPREQRGPEARRRAARYAIPEVPRGVTAA